MSDLRALYQEVIFDHNRNPRNFGSLEGANRTASGNNPLCGDELEVTLLLDDEGVIRDIRFQGRGCAISTASASIMTETLKGRTLAEARRYFEHFHAMVRGEPREEPELATEKMEVLSGVSEYPARVKCASLAWHTVNAALDQSGSLVTTE